MDGNRGKYLGHCEWRNIQDKNNVHSFLSYGLDISILIENNLIEYLDGDNKFKTTEKGLNYLKMHNQIEELLQVTTIKND